MNEFALRLMKCAREYERFIHAKLLSKQSLNSDDLASIQKEAISKFPELKGYQFDNSPESVELELFNKVLRNIMLKVGFRLPNSHWDNNSSIYIRR